MIFAAAPSQEKFLSQLIRDSADRLDAESMLFIWMNI